MSRIRGWIQAFLNGQARSQAGWRMISAVLVVAVGAAYVLLLPGAVADKMGIFTGVLGGVGFLGQAAWPLLKPRRTPTEMSAADRLSEAIHRQWQTEVAKRHQHAGFQDNPIDVTWTFLSDDDDHGQKWRATPDLVRPAEVAGADLAIARGLSGGGTADLCKVALALPQGRLVIQGGPGSGKTAILLRMLIGTLNHRRKQAPDVRAQIPVPVLLSLADWQPASAGLVEFAAETLARDIPSLRSDAATDSVAELIRSGQVCLLLDGLEETTDHQLVIQELNAAKTLRIVLTSWPDTYADAVGGGHPRKPLAGAAVVQLLPVGEGAIREYFAVLEGFRRNRPDLDRLIERLTAPASSASPGDTALNTPLYLSLIAEFHRADGPGALLDFPTTKLIAEHLIEEIIPRAYPEGQRYSVEEAQRWFQYLARRMLDYPNGAAHPTEPSAQAKPLSWSYISEWAPHWLTRSVYGSCAGLWMALSAWVALEGRPHPAVNVGYVPLVWGIAAGLGYVISSALDLRLTRQPVVGVAIGIAGGLGFGLMGGLRIAVAWANQTGRPLELTAWLIAAGLSLLLGIGLALLMVTIGLKSERMLKRRQWPSSFGRGRPSWNSAGILALLCGGFLVNNRSTGSVVLVSLSFVIAVWAESLVAPQESLRGATSARQSVRHDLTAWIALGVVVGICGSLLWSAAFHTRPEAVAGWFVPLFLITVLSSHTSGYLLAVGYLAATGRLPLAPLRFLEDAWTRDVMRRNGWRYEFRHRTLLEQLGGIAPSAGPGSAGAVIQLPPDAVLLPESESEPATTSETDRQQAP